MTKAALLLSVILWGPVVQAQFDDSNWKVQYHESFDSSFTLTHGQVFGEDGWLTCQLIGGGSITVQNGYAQLLALDFWNAALIRSRGTLPPEYKIRTRIGHINYDLSNYEQADFDDGRFNSHGGYYENGVYFLTLTDDTCADLQCAEEWWHYHRKMVIDTDNHLNFGGGGETVHPVYMVYMAPQINSLGNLLRTWTGSVWDTSPWNWNVAYTYDYDTWYYAEVEKRGGYLTLRLYDGQANLIEETTPVNLGLIFAMDDPTEFLYLGEPHTDDYEGDARLDDITLLVPDSLATGVGDEAGHVPLTVGGLLAFPNPFNAGTVVQFTLARPASVKVSIFNAYGQRVVSWPARRLTAGEHSVPWNGKDAAGHDLPTGLYFCRVLGDGSGVTQKLLLLR